MQTQHIIRKQTIDFQYNGNTDGFALQKEVSDWCKFMLIPEIEQQLELFDFGDNYVTIDKLEIDAAIDKKDWQQRIRNELISSLSLKLRDYKPGAKKAETGQENISRSYKLDELILFYFAKGYLPWWSKAFIETDFETVLFNWITEDKSQQRADNIVLKLQQINAKPVLNRIINLVEQEIFFTWVKNIFKKEVETIAEAESFFTTIFKASHNKIKEKEIALDFFEVILGMLIKNEGKIDIDTSVYFFRVLTRNQAAITTSLLKIIRVGSIPASNVFVKSWNNIVNHEIKDNVAKKNEEQKEEGLLQYQRTIDQLMVKNIAEKNIENIAEDLREGIYIDNGGAVIIAAFLPILFERLKITKNNEIIKPGLATLLIQYIVTGKIKIEEHELVLPKILCGISLELSLDTTKKISRIQKNEADDMLRSVIEHWTVIKNTSVEGLRESFLQRSAKLILSDDEWLLQVEQKPYDMLLLQLPWNISMIKLPWMKGLLKTEWV